MQGGVGILGDLGAAVHLHISILLMRGADTAAAVQQEGLVKRQRILSRHCNGHLSPIQNVPPFKMHPTTFVCF